MAYTFSHHTAMASLSTLFCLVLAACGGESADAADASQDSVVAQASVPGTQQPQTSQPRRMALALAAADLADIVRPFGTAHEALPAGVPLDYDWARMSKQDGGNRVPAGFTAFTGWGQAFWASDATAGGQAVEIRDNQTFLCTVSGSTRQWLRVQRGDIEGAAFLASFAGNENMPATVDAVQAGHARVRFPAGRAFHYWPRQGRITLEGDSLCGTLVVFQARAVANDGSPLAAGATSALLVGAGGDYWSTLSAPWDNYKTNVGVGVGQLRRLTPQWRWYGLNTASAADLQQLAQSGFVDRTGQ